jgi:hypothetical protein
MMKKGVILALGGLVILLLWLIVAPPRWWLNLTKRVDVSAQTGAALVDKYGCRECHAIGDAGATLASGLNDVTLRLSPTVIRRTLIVPPRGMPNMRLSDSEIRAILIYLEMLANQIQ